ncbi:hypothetical protein GCM10027059_20260 [Myceligenerans halotolerans]
MIRTLLVDDQAVVRAGYRVLLEDAGDIEVVGEASNGPAAVREAARLRPDVVCMDVRMPGGDGIAATRQILAAANTMDPNGADTGGSGPGGSRHGAGPDDGSPGGSGPGGGRHGAGPDDGSPGGSGPGGGRQGEGPGGGGPGDGRQGDGPAPVAPAVLVVTTFDLDDYVFGALEAGASGFLLKDCEPEELITAVRRLAAGEGMVDQAVTRRVITEFARRTRRTATAPGPAAALTERETEIVRLLASGMSNAEIARELYVETSTVKSHLGRAMTKIGTRDRVQTVVWAYRHGLAEL